MRWKPYKKDCGYSYTLGAYPTMELCIWKGDQVEEVILSDSFIDTAYIEKLKRLHIPYRYDEKSIARLARKGNTYVAGIFRPSFEEVLAGSHLVCDQISDMGNLGSIMRTMVAMNLFDMVLIGNSCDPLHPRTLRASMGSFAHIRLTYFNTMKEYLEHFPDRKLYLFMLDSKAKPLSDVHPKGTVSLVFGNEGSGLPKEYASFGKSIYIPQSRYVDSLNLTTACAMALYHFQVIHKGGHHA